MRLYRVTGSGTDGVEACDEPTPDPGPGEALVRVRATSLNYRDLLMCRRDPIRGALPQSFIPLSDGAGDVVAVGAGVTRFAVGDRVAGNFVQDWIYGPARHNGGQSLGGGIDGMLTEYRALPEHGLVPLPAHLSYAEGACLPCAGVTAWNALRNVRADETVLLLGTGGVSVMALQIAHHAGARTIITSSSDEKLARARAMGADEIINYREKPEWQEEVLGLTGGVGVDHVVEVGGAGTLSRSIEATAGDGTVHIIGVLTSGTIDPTPIMLRGINVHGVRVGSREMFERLNDFVARHGIRPVIDRRFGFDEVREAYHHLQAGVHFGKIVIELEH